MDCDAECITNTDCPDYCSSSSTLMGGRTCNTACTSCSCTTGFATDCTKTCTSDGCMSKTCTGGACSGTSDCGAYTCSVGTGCTTICSVACGAECDAASGCSSTCVTNPGRRQDRACDALIGGGPPTCKCGDSGAAYCSVGRCNAACAADSGCPADGWLYCNVNIRENRDYSCATSSTCTCTYTVAGSEDCAAKVSVDSDAGDVPRTAGTCTDYTTCSPSSPSACQSTPYADVCASAAALTEYYASGASCPSKPYTCSGFEVAATDTDSGDDPTAIGTCTPKTAAGCASGAFSTAAGTGGGTDYCLGTCGAAVNSCNYIEYYPVDSADGCPGLDSCASKTYDPDATSHTCNTCAGANRWTLGGDDCDPMTAGVQTSCCCGDDPSEHVRTRVCDGFVCTNSTSDDACCDQANDCVSDGICYSNGDPYPIPLHGGICSNGIWKDMTAPITAIIPNGGDYPGQNWTEFTLECLDTGGAWCSKTRYKIINSTQDCVTAGTYITVNAGSVKKNVTCPFGKICELKVCFYSNDSAGNTEAAKQSNTFHLETNACQGLVCGQPCLFTPGICNATSGNCYSGGCMLNCSVLAAGSGNERVWINQNCGRTGSYKCDDDAVCGNSFTSCITGGVSTKVTGNWASYVYPAGSYGVGYTFRINLTGVTKSPSGFTILSECSVIKPNSNKIIFDNWGTDASYNYTIKSGDPEGIWTVDYCGLYSDFFANDGWTLKEDSVARTFAVDKSGPSIIINTPKQNDIYNADFAVNATVTDTYSPISGARYRWQNSTANGPWIPITRNIGNAYIATFSVLAVSDGYYTINVSANDTIGNVGSATVNNVRIDRQPPAITITKPTPKWFRTSFDVTATVTDSQGVASVRYRWENSTTNGTWTQMTLESGDIYDAPFVITSVAPNTNANNYTFRVWSNDTKGNNVNVVVTRVGIDYVSPSSQMISPSSGAFVMNKVFNISWSGSDAHSGVKCYNVVYRYCNNNNGQCSSENYTIPFAGGACTNLTLYTFDTTKELWWVQDPNNYTFFFKSVATDIAGNVESKPAWDANITVYIPKLVSFSLTENTTKLNVRNGGKVPNRRNVIISVSALPSVTENINITVFYANHTLGMLPLQWTEARCYNTRQCNVTIKINVSEAESIREVDYYIMAQNSTMMEYLPPSAPNSYFYYSVYYHSICNFLVVDEYRTILGSADLIALEIRNIHDQADNITLALAPNYGRFVENDATNISMVLNPAEEKIIYARLVPAMEGFLLQLNGISQNDITLSDEDTVDIRVDMPPNFSELGDSAAIALILLAGALYFVLISKK
ncbi:MAG: hypothetical protein NTU57_00715 [Candidatus Aenigmarchaeota archaeon]|nr:hypothetical protein [Candidatus Aenigmarchaeota archaeon]